MNFDSNRQQTDGSDDLALLNEELMWLIAYDNPDEIISTEDTQASSDPTRKTTGINNKPVLLSSAAIIIAGASLFTPDYAFADDQVLAAENARLKQLLLATRKERDALKEASDDSHTPAINAASDSNSPAAVSAATAAKPSATSIAAVKPGAKDYSDEPKNFYSVGVMADNVRSTWAGSIWASYADIDHVEALHGPQGKNSNLGLVGAL